jgi:hypothetical protein
MALPVVTIDVARPQYGLPAFANRSANQQLLNPIERGELANLATAIEDLGYGFKSTWNGRSTITGSVGLHKPAHPTLIAAVDRYRAGCPAHDTVFCGRTEGCSWFADGLARVILPDWTATP